MTLQQNIDRDYLILVCNLTHGIKCKNLGASREGKFICLKDTYVSKTLLKKYGEDGANCDGYESHCKGINTSKDIE